MLNSLNFFTFTKCSFLKSWQHVATLLIKDLQESFHVFFYYNSWIFSLNNNVLLKWLWKKKSTTDSEYFFWRSDLGKNISFLKTKRCWNNNLSLSLKWIKKNSSIHLQSTFDPPFELVTSKIEPFWFHRYNHGKPKTQEKTWKCF